MSARERRLVVTLLTRTFSDAEARELAAWSYPAPFDIYNVDSDYPELFQTRTAAGEGYYPAVDEDGAVIAFCVLGAEARVCGQEAAPGTVDVGLGVRPGLTGLGLGTELTSLAITLAESALAPQTLRVAVATFNMRSLALCRSAGFLPVRDFFGPGERPFRELTLSLGHSAGDHETTLSPPNTGSPSNSTTPDGTPSAAPPPDRCAAGRANTPGTPYGS